MSSTTEQLHLAPNDTITSLRVSLSQLRGKRVVLIWTPDCDNLKRRLDLVLIQREADRNAIQLAIVAQDPNLQAHADELNISCFDSIEASQNQRWKRSRNKVFLPRYHRPRADLQPSDLARIADRLGGPRHSSNWRIRIVRAAVILLLCAVVGALVYVIAPGAVIRVQLRSERVAVTVEVTADHKAEAVDRQRALIPAIRLRETIETSASIPSSGTQWQDGESAAGGSDRSVKVVAAADKTRLLDIARLQLQSLAYDRMRAGLSEGQVIIIESLQIAEENKDWLDYSAVVGAAASELSLTMRAVVSALAVDERLARQVVLAQLEAAVPPDMTLQTDSLVYERGAFNLSRAKEQIRFTAHGMGIALASLDADSLREQLAGADLDAARSILRDNRAFSQQPAPRLSLHPRGFGRMPLLPIRIHIEVQADS